MREWSIEATEEDVMAVVEGGLCGMIEASKGKGKELSPELMINAAIHILSAWVASSQVTSSTAERDADLNDLLDLLPGCIEYHRTARWLPNPHRADH